MKENIFNRIIYAGKYKIEDGLVNGIAGIFKMYTSKNIDVDML